jgi:hypothetical protein
MMDAASTLDDSDAQPRPGDFTICFHCSALLMFDANLRQVRVPSNVRVSKEALRYQRIVKEWNRRTRR